MNILGISDSHEAAACLFVDGQLVAACAEERLTRLKSDMGYPRLAVEFCLAHAGIGGDALDAVAFASLNAPAAHIRIKREATFSVRDWVDEQNRYWKRVLAGDPVSYHELFSSDPAYIKDHYYDFSTVFDDAGVVDHQAFRRVRAETVAQHIGVAPQKVHFIVHERCHALYGYFGSTHREPALVFTCEGEGDHSNATVSTIAPGQALEERCRTRENHLAHYYRYVTLLLGMKPNQHEYKVMGLAPYASDYEVSQCMPVFEGLLEVRDGNLVSGRPIPDRYFHFMDAFQGLRFDGIAGALQGYLEDRLQAWTADQVARTGIGHVVFSGGVAQNIKAMKALRDVEGVTSVHVNPISGDGSLSIGACYGYLHEHHADVPPQPLTNIYLGPVYDRPALDEALTVLMRSEQVIITERPDPHQVAALLRDNLIVARCVGRMEFGQRALGNRSILANPASFENVRKLNRQIKRRDFWMPFTPTILDARAEEYLVRPADSPYMTMAFDSTPLGRRDLAAAIHPADFTVRPQILKRDANPAYYDLIQAFEALTGVGALLNTSLNLHGEPVVCSPADALHTFSESELDAILFDDVLVVRSGKVR